MTSQESTIILKCIKEKSKLRVRIVSQGYLGSANCQFPRAIRKEGVYYRVPISDVNLITRTNKYYYNVKGKNIEIIENEETKISRELLESIKIFEDTESLECCICLTNDKQYVFIPCGHYYCCGECSSRVKECPICRTKIDKKVDKKEFG